MIVTLDVFSGRPNPSWQLGKDQARDLRRRLDGLARAAPRIGRQPPDLGYRGLLVESKGEPWTKTPLRVYGGVVLRAGVRLADPERVVERWLLLTGQGVVDTPLLDALLLDLGQH